jgi:hypothetical protein
MSRIPDSKRPISRPAEAEGVLNWEPTVLAAVFCLALALRAIALFQLKATPYFPHLLVDAESYDNWAQTLAAGDWMGWVATA